MAQAPVEPHSLVALEAFPCLFNGRRRERGGEDGRRPWGRLLEDLMLGGYTTMLVAMSTTLADVLLIKVSVEDDTRYLGQDGPTDLTGVVDITWVWKLKGLGAAAPELPFCRASDSEDMMRDEFCWRLERDKQVVG